MSILNRKTKQIQSVGAAGSRPEEDLFAPEPYGPAVEDYGRGYSDQWELMTDEFALIDYRLYLYYKNHQWLGPRNDMRNMLGLVVTREEFEHNLVKAAETGLYTHITPDDRRQMEMGEQTVAARIRNTAADASLPLLKLIRRFELDEFEENILLLAYAATLDRKYERLFAYLQDDITKKVPTISLAVQLYLPESRTAEEYAARFEQETLFTSLFESEARHENKLVLCGAVLQYLCGGTVTPSGGMTLFDGTKESPDEMMVGGNMAAALDALLKSSQYCAASVSGDEGSGRSYQVRQLMARHGEQCLFVDMDALEHKPEAVQQAALMARLTGAYLCFDGVDGVDQDGAVESAPPALLDAISRVRPDKNVLFMISRKPVTRQIGAATVDFPLSELTAEERLALFKRYFDGIPVDPDVSIEELAAKFHFTPRQISLAAGQAGGLYELGTDKRLSNGTLHMCCYRQAVHKLDRLAVRVQPKFTWDDVVLPQAQKNLMQQACAHIRFQHRVYHEWGFEKKIGYGKGLSILFAGAPGTGKTMCAQVIAKQLNMQMYKINISQIVSKYIGETEKNLQAVFQEAKKSNSILFFDECDAIFGKRSDVKDAHDRNANVEVAYLLQQIEDHDGVCVLATNLMQNIDAAFMRRITYVVHFPFPDQAMRKAIYLHTLPDDAPREENIDWDFLAEKFELSGGHIKNIVLESAFMAANRGKPIGMRELLNAAVNELKKNEIVVVRDELREYADLIED